MSVQFQGFDFHLAPWTCGIDAGTAILVVETNGTAYYGQTSFAGPANGPGPTPWFAPDFESGVYQSSPADRNVTLYVEVGS